MGRNVSVANAAYDALLRGAALHLSNMENMEWLSGAPLLADPRHPELTGPVINSRRQLWSVGAYVGMVVRNVFGIALDQDSLLVQPLITTRLRRETFGASRSITLERLRLRDKTIRVHIALPASTPGAGYFEVASITLNGRPAGASIQWQQLEADNTIEIGLGAVRGGRQEIRRVAGDPMAIAGALFAPFEVRVATALRTARGEVALRIDDAHNAPGSVHYQLYRNGALVADRLTAPEWTDRLPTQQANCYSVAAVAAVAADGKNSGKRSHNSAALCLDAGIEIAMSDPRVTSNRALQAGAAVFKDWGAPQDTFSVQPITLAAGRYSFQLRYQNTGHALNTGISNGVKVLSVRDAAGQTVARRVIQMPHLAADGAPQYSTPADVLLIAGPYSVDLGDFYNMSYLASNSVYGAGGGKAGPLNRVDIHALRIRARASAAPADTAHRP